MLDSPLLDEASYAEMAADPEWIEATAARAEAHRRRDQGDYAAHEAITVQAGAGLGLTSHSEADLLAATERAAGARQTHDVTLVTLVSELVSRGVQAPGGLSRSDWLRSHDPSLTAGQANAFLTVGTALSLSRWARLRLLVATQQVTVTNAAQIIDFDARTRPVADPEDLQTALTDLTEQAARLRPEELSRLVRHHTEQVRPPRDQDRLDQGRLAARGLWFTRPNPTGMVRLRGVLDPEGAAILTAAIDPLSAPCPETDDHGRTVTPDERTPARRRMDALLALVQRGVAAADGVPVTDKAKVVVLIDLESLIDDVQANGRGTTGGAGGHAHGAGITLTGDILSPGAVRRIACDAEIIPLVLGSDSEPLDMGRGKRLFTRGQRLTLTIRDKGCSYPGCTVPPTWCDAHHVIHWSRGGPTSLPNAALLCPRHHTLVHDRDLTATITATGVTWHT